MINRLKIKTFLRLGIKNLIQVGFYRLGLRTKLHPVIRLQREIGGTEFFGPSLRAKCEHITPVTWRDSAHYFGWYKVPLTDAPPQWHYNPFNGQRAGGEDQPWWQLSDFKLPVGDIKTIWELSRFDWVVAMAQRSAMGESSELVRLNNWLADWCNHNPAFLGSNWKCGQEASIRVMHLALASKILGQDSSPSTDLTRLIEAHLARIHPTLSYAMAQDNNHGTSEAAALFIGGSLCEAAGMAQGRRWARDGRRWLENRVHCLVESDGSFSQHSLNYHRVLLDTLCMVELWRGWQNLPEFSGIYLDRVRGASDWLYHMIDPGTGYGPNLGDNDGANLLPLTGADFRDFRPTVQLAKALFSNQLAYAQDGPHNSLLDWFEVSRPTTVCKAPQSRHFSDGGYAVLRRGALRVLFKYPQYRFRPRHCDALHLDLWHGSNNILRDAGSYSYNTDQPWQDYFPGNSGHNTVEFDNRDQMPSVSRFLRGAWLKASDIEFNDDVESEATAASGYTDWQGASHVREVKLSHDRVVVKDKIDGFKRCAILRWRLQPGEWALTESGVRGAGFELRIHADVRIVRLEMVEGWESHYYMQKTPLPVLEVELQAPGQITTEINYGSSL